jgi:DNA-binding NarL/FixJ family response regulator
VATGNSNKLIAVHLDITEDTAKAHVKSILSKLGAKDRTHAVTIALRRGIIQL